MADQAITATHYLHKENETLSGLIRVESVADGMVEFVRDGGGYVIKWPVERFLDMHRATDDAEIERLLHSHKLVDAWGDWFPDGAKPMKAWTNDYRWNGWLMPKFERQTVMEALEDGRIQWTGLSCFYVEEADTFISIDAQGDDVPEYDREEIALAAFAGSTEVVITEDGKVIALEGLDDKQREKAERQGTTVYLEVDKGFDLETPMGVKRCYAIGSCNWTWYEAPKPEHDEEPEAGEDNGPHP